MTTCDLVIVLPIYNEINRIALIEQFSQQILEYVQHQNHRRTTILYVDDGSTDGSQSAIGELIQTLRLDFPSIPIAHSKFSHNTRKSGMYLEALAQMDAHYYLFVDSDASFRIEDVAKCIELAANYDVLLAKKRISQSHCTLPRQLATRLHSFLTQKIFEGIITDTQTGLKVFSRCAAEKTFTKVRPWHFFASDFVLAFEAYRNQLRMCQIPVDVTHQPGSHVRIIRDGLHYLFVISITILSSRWSSSKQLIEVEMCE